MSLPIYETLQGYSQMIQAHHAMGYSFYALAQYDSSIHHAQIALQLMARVKDSTNLQDNYLNMGLAYAGLKDYNAAINWYKKNNSRQCSYKPAENTVAILSIFG